MNLKILNYSNFQFDEEPLFELISNNLNTEYIFWNVGESDCAPFNYMGSYGNAIDILKKNNSSIHVILGGHNRRYLEATDYSPYINFYNWKTHLLHYTNFFLQLILNKNITEININKNFDKLFYCFNNKSHYHRCLLIDQIYKNNLQNNNIITWRKTINSTYINYNFKYFNNNFIEYDNIGNYLNDDISWINESILNMNCFLNVVTETTCSDNNIFVTEKTFKPLLIGQPFICLGSKSQNTFLKTYGFELYDEIFDYSFDELDSLEGRVDGIIKNLLRLKNDNFFLLYEKIKNKVEFNKKRCIEIINNDIFLPKYIVDRYKSHKDIFYENYKIQYDYKSGWNHTDKLNFNLMGYTGISPYFLNYMKKTFDEKF